MPQTIASERLLLRPLRPTDTLAVFHYRSDPETVRYQMWRPTRETEVRDFIRDLQDMIPGIPGFWYQFAVTLQQNERLIGDCGIHVPLEAVDVAELGITLAPEFQGYGYATECLAGLVSYCFDTLHMRLIVARSDPENRRSIALIERCGFQISAAERHGLTTDGDDLFYVLDHASWLGKDRPSA